MQRLSLNQKTTDRWNLEQAVQGCVDAEIPWIGLWREPVAEVGLDEATRIVTEANLGVSSLCRGGFFPSSNDEEWEQAIADNHRAIDEAAALGTDTLVLVCGGIAAGDLDRSRQQVADGIAAVATHAGDLGVRLAIEPLHPMFGADRSVIVTLAQALDIAEQFHSDVVGVVVDTFHLWWDPDVWTQIDRAAGRICSYQICDWLDPLPDVLLGRGMMGDGVIDFERFTRAVVDAGYTGPIEVEIFNQAIWDTPGDQVIATMTDRYESLVAPFL